MRFVVSIWTNILNIYFKPSPVYTDQKINSEVSFEVFMSGFRIPFSKIYYLLFLLLVAIFRMILALLQDFSFWISFHSFEHSAFYNSQSFQDLCRYFFHMFGFSVSWPSVLQRFLPWTCLSPLLLRSYPRLFHQQTMY